MTRVVAVAMTVVAAAAAAAVVHDVLQELSVMMRTQIVAGALGLWIDDAQLRLQEWVDQLV